MGCAKTPSPIPHNTMKRNDCKIEFIPVFGKGGVSYVAVNALHTSTPRVYPTPFFPLDLERTA